MNFPSREIVERVRKEYPVGTRVELVSMDDPQAPPVGTKGTVMRVDDTASLLMHWDTGSGLNVVYGEDIVKKLPDEHYCPKCKKIYTGYPALSREDNKTCICPDCGTYEALKACGATEAIKKLVMAEIHKE